MTIKTLVIFKAIILFNFLSDVFVIILNNYHELYTRGISETDIPYLKWGFNQYATDFCYYNMFIDYHTGQFEKIPIRKRRIERNYQRLPKMKVA